MALFYVEAKAIILKHYNSSKGQLSTAPQTAHVIYSILMLICSNILSMMAHYYLGKARL